jgi:hypothetical protein
MSRSRLATALLVLLVTVAVTAYAGTNPVNFGSVELGQVETACVRLFGPAEIQTISVGAPFQIRGIRIGDESDGVDVCQNVPGLTTPVTLPQPINASQQLVFDVDVVPTELGDADQTVLVNGQPLFDISASIEVTSGCVDSSTANCLQGDRFKTRVHWRTDFGTRGDGPVVPAQTDDSGLFYFFNADNWEMLIKVLDGCQPNNHYWVFAAATTNVEYTITVVDTQEQEAVAYFKPQGPSAPAITDTGAFATCP